MNTFKKLVKRGFAVMREFNDNDNLSSTEKRMIAELAAVALVAAGGKDMEKWTPKEQVDKANTVRIALTSALQIGKNEAVMCPMEHKKA